VPGLSQMLMFSNVAQASVPRSVDGPPPLLVVSKCQEARKKEPETHRALKPKVEHLVESHRASAARVRGNSFRRQL